MTPAEYKKLQKDADEFAMKHFDRSDDVAAVSFRLIAVITSHLKEVEMREARRSAAKGMPHEQRP